jgi:PIN domain nuclease of toxin-antitoxin system
VAELTIKASIGKLPLPFDPVEMIERSGFEMLDFSGHDALRLQNMPFHHRDPFDRMLMAQALTHDLYLMSRDEKFTAYGCKLI